MKKSITKILTLFVFSLMLLPVTFIRAQETPVGTAGRDTADTDITSEDTADSSEIIYEDFDQLYEDFDDLFGDAETYLDSSSYDEVAEAGLVAGLFATTIAVVIAIIGGVFGLAVYIYTSLAMSKIAKKLNHENPWFAWIPILNVVQLFQMGDQNPWLILLVLIPGLGALVVGIISVIAFMNICEKRGYDKLLGLLVLIPIAQFVLIGILAWGNKKA